MLIKGHQIFTCADPPWNGPTSLLLCSLKGNQIFTCADPLEWANVSLAVLIEGIRYKPVLEFCNSLWGLGTE
jgi:hypothetical protein